jgi:hypothetical protein
MKKLKYFLAVCLIAIISTGCVKYNATMDIKNDKSMDFVIVYALDKSVMGDMGSLKEEDFSELKKEGYTLEKYSEGNFEGFKITKTIKNIDDISTDKDVEFDLSGMMENDENNKYMFKVVKNGDKNTYYAKFKFDSNDSSLNDDDNTNEGGQALPDEEDNSLTITDAGSDDSLITPNDDNNGVDTSNIDMSKLMDSMDLSFNVNLPSSAISSNATSKSDNDKKLSWKLNYNGAQTIEFAFEIDPNAKSDSNMLLYIGIGAGVLVLIIAVVAIILSSKKKNKVNVPVNEETKKETVEENK